MQKEYVFVKNTQLRFASFFERCPETSAHGGATPYILVGSSKSNVWGKAGGPRSALCQLERRVQELKRSCWKEICNEGLYDFIDLSSSGRKKKTELVATPNIGIIGGPVETLWQATELFPNGIVEGMVTDSLL